MDTSILYGIIVVLSMLCMFLGILLIESKFHQRHSFNIHEMLQAERFGEYQGVIKAIRILGTKVEITKSPFLRESLNDITVLGTKLKDKLIPNDKVEKILLEFTKAE